MVIKVLVGCTGSVASLKVSPLVEGLLKHGLACHTLSQRAILDCQFDKDMSMYSIAFKRDNSAGTRQGGKLKEVFIFCDNLKTKQHKFEVKVVTTEKALHFFSQTKVDVEVLRDEDEWKTWQQLSDPVLHIELRRWADILVIAPLDANTMAKMMHGICDNLLTCVVRAWDLKRPLLFAPAMNTHMWDHPVTKQQVDGLKGFGYIEIPVVEKKLACGDTGFGAMAEVTTILEYVQKAAETVGTTQQNKQLNDAPCS